MNKKVNEVNWKKHLKVTPTHGVDTLADPFINKVVATAKEAKVPKYPCYHKGANKSKHQNLLDERNSLNGMLAHPDMTNKDKENKEKKIEELNLKIQEDHEQERQRKEDEAIKKIQVDPKYYFKFANRTKKLKSKIGPLRSGDSYYSGPREMVRILSDQYKSVFSKQKENYDSVHYERKTGKTLSEIVLTKDRFALAMKNIKYSSAPGPDGVPAYLYRKFADALAEPVILI